MAAIATGRGLRSRVTALARFGLGVIGDLEAFVFPQLCPSCGRQAAHDALLCPGCRSAIPRPAVPLCARCLVMGREPVGCGHAGGRTWVALLYDERAALLVRALKYGGRPGLAKRMGEAIAEAVPRSYRPDLVLEVPLHAARLRERGYNQAALLADALAAALRAPRLSGALIRVRPTRAQTASGSGQRRENLAGAFRVAVPAALAGRKVLVVDDVVTTGATMEACLAALGTAGARPRGAAFAWAQ